MKRILVALCILLFLWISGSSFWYVCKIRDNCNSGQEITIDNEQKEETLLIDEPDEADSLMKDSRANSLIPPPAPVDSLSIARAYMQNVQTKTIYFDFAKSETKLSEDDREYLKMLRIYMDNEPGKGIYLTGHSDSKGSPEANMYASGQRALFVSGLLTEAGIREDLIKSKGLGDKEPAESNQSPEGRAKNRRVEITIKNQ